MVAGESCIPTISPELLSSTASDWTHDPSVLSGEVATHTRVAATTLISTGCAAQPPAGEDRVPHAATRRPVFISTERLEGPPESEHWRSSHAWLPGSVIGIGGPNVAPLFVEVITNMLCVTGPVNRLWNI